METFLNGLLQYGIPGFLAIGFIVLTPLLPKYLDAILYVFKIKKRNRELAIKDAISTEGISGSSKEIMNQQREVDLYYKALNIQADYYLIQKINDLLEKSKGQITVWTVRNALIHLSVDSNGIVVTINKSDILIKNVLGYLFWLLVITDIIMVFAVLSALQDLLNQPSNATLGLFIAYLIYFIAALVGTTSFLKARLEVIAAEKIIKYLVKSQDISYSINNCDIYNTKVVNKGE